MRVALPARLRAALRRDRRASLAAPEFVRHTPEERRALVASLFGASSPDTTATD
jgi:hypothetical protein